jgi:hypothetical protein
LQGFWRVRVGNDTVLYGGQMSSRTQSWTFGFAQPLWTALPNSGGVSVMLTIPTNTPNGTAGAFTFNAPSLYGSVSGTVPFLYVCGPEVRVGVSSPRRELSRGVGRSVPCGRVGEAPLQLFL